ncbi:MAG: DUF5615 family PIN-like protein [Selenomonadaceae bacterium]|nr:DUF5615 family PIN-like protein [Selenomonadaceae bacterium]
MRFLLDENFPCSIAAVLRDCGHEAISFADACGAATVVSVEQHGTACESRRNSP